MRIVFGGLIFVLLSCMQCVVANDEIHLTTGDQLIGEVTSINSQYVTIDTAFAKQLKIEHELIKKLNTESKVVLVFEDGRVLESVLLKESDGVIQHESVDGIMPLMISDLVENPEQMLALKNSQADEAEIKYSGNIDIGLSKTSGNEDDEDYHASLMLQARTLKNRYTLEAAKTIEKNDGDKTQDETYGSLQYDRFINEKWYAFASASFEEDLEEQLNLRSTYSLGSGYQFFEEDDLTLKTELGFAYVDEDFDEDDDNNYAGGRWAIDYEHAWLQWLGFFHSQQGFFSMENINDMNIRSSTGFKFPLNDFINAKLEANVDWNRSPAEGATGTDKEYIFTLGYKF